MTKIKDIKIRDFHALRWDEPVIMEMNVPGERGVLVPKAEETVQQLVGDGVSVLGALKRKVARPYRKLLNLFWFVIIIGLPLRI